MKQPFLILITGILLNWVIQVTTTWLSKESILLIIAKFEELEKERSSKPLSPSTPSSSSNHQQKQQPDTQRLKEHHQSKHHHNTNTNKTTHHALRGHDRRSSAPFISGDGFRQHIIMSSSPSSSSSSYVCDETNHCHISNPESIANGVCIFIKTEYLETFVHDIIPRIKNSYKIITHNSDLSSPDGQNDARIIRMKKYTTSHILLQEYRAGRLIAHHGVNTWYINSTLSMKALSHHPAADTSTTITGSSGISDNSVMSSNSNNFSTTITNPYHNSATHLPAYSHCLPLGIENRHSAIGKHVRSYIDIWKHQYHITDDEIIMNSKSNSNNSSPSSTNNINNNNNNNNKQSASSSSQSTHVADHLNPLLPKYKRIEAWSHLPLLLVSFSPKAHIPDRKKVLMALYHSQSDVDASNSYISKTTVGQWYNETVTVGSSSGSSSTSGSSSKSQHHNQQHLSHNEWLRAITEHRFVLAPFGHSLDTHRLTEIWLMGGVPVIKRSSITSCYDDSDNIYTEENNQINNNMNAQSQQAQFSNTRTTTHSHRHTRGNLPIVILDSWIDLSRDRLEREWSRIVPLLLDSSHWDWRRLLIDQWLDRINCPATGTTSSS